MIIKKCLKKYFYKIFHKIFYNSRIWEKIFWYGIPVQKCPFDLWVYQEIISQLKPDLIIETGTAQGAALFFANLLDLNQYGEVVTIDIIDHPNKPNHKRIKYLKRSSISPEILLKVEQISKNKKKIMVILDSNHEKNHVLRELKEYSKFVSKGSYLIAEDTNINGHPVRPDFGPGPWEAVEKFFKEDNSFIVDSSKEKFPFSFNPRGFLLKIK